MLCWWHKILIGAVLRAKTTISMGSIGSPIQIKLTKYQIKTKTLDLGYIVSFDKEINTDYWGNNWRCISLSWLNHFGSENSQTEVKCIFTWWLAIAVFPREVKSWNLLNVSLKRLQVFYGVFSNHLVFFVCLWRIDHESILAWLNDGAKILLKAQLYLCKSTIWGDSHLQLIKTKEI